MVGAHQSTAKAKLSKPSKPRPDFPLFPHARGYWAKKVRGKLVYFGKIASDPDGTAAVNKWLDEKDALLAGRTPRAHREGLTVKDLCNRFLTAKRMLVDSKEISPRTFADYLATAERIANAFGKERLVEDLASEDFDGLRASLGKTLGPVAVGNEVNRIRVLFKFGYDAGLFDKPVRYGPHFKRPSRKVIRQARAAKGPRMFEASEIRRILDACANPQVRAMILLGINCGLGNSDCGSLERRHIDLKGGWLNYPRPKTAVDRRAKLWSETVLAVKEAIAARPDAKDEVDADLVFITRTGASWSKDVADSPISKEFGKLLDETGLKQAGRSFYALRHTFETIGGEARDQVATSHVMGHAPAASDMSATYRERVTDDRLKAVSDHVRRWLYPASKKRKAK